MYMYIRALYSYICTYICTYTHIYIYRYTNMYTYVYIHTYANATYLSYSVRLQLYATNVYTHAHTYK